MVNLTLKVKKIFLALYCIVKFQSVQNQSAAGGIKQVVSTGGDEDEDTKLFLSHTEVF